MSNKQLGMEKDSSSVTLLLSGLWDQKYQQYVNRFLRNTVKKYLQVFQRSGLIMKEYCPYRTRNSRSYSTKRPE